MRVSLLLGCVLPSVTALAQPAAETLEARQEPAAAASSSWFLPNLDHTSGPVRGYVPNLYDANGKPVYSYPVYKSVSDVKDLANAITSDGPKGQRDNCWLVGQPRVVYLAPGTYTLSSTLYFNTDTILIGDAKNPPTIRAAPGFNGDYLVVGGQGDDDARPCGGYFGETHFSVMIKNVILDTSANAGKRDFTALSWAVAQNCALVNVKINMPQGAHTGMVLKPGSTISVSDVTFTYGNVGLQWSGHQQGQLKGLTFDKCTTGIAIDKGNTISIFAPTCKTVGRCIVLNSGNPWVAVVDGQSINSGTFFTSASPHVNFMLENIAKDTLDSNMVEVDGVAKVGKVGSLGTYIYGNTYDGGSRANYQTNPTARPVSRPAALLAPGPGGRFPNIAAPQYADRTAGDVVNLKDARQNGGFTLRGDGSSDDTAALQGALDTAARQGKLAYLPFGVYRVTSTITVPAGTELYGEGWPAISGSGAAAFGDEANPRPVVQIGARAGERGTARIQDVRFTVNEALPGAILLRVNMAGASPGDVAVFNSLTTVGGTRDTSLSCGDERACRAAYVGLHLAAGSSAYVDNFWSWVADHATDDSGRGIRTAVKGGVLVEATAGTWLAGLGSEHNWLYQLALHDAANVLVSLFQSETNYNQGNNGAALPGSEEPFSPRDRTPSDPDYSWCAAADDRACRMGLAQYYVGNNSAVWHYAAGSWNFDSLTKVSQGLMNYIRDPVTVGGGGPDDAHHLHLHGYTVGPKVSRAVRLPGGKQFGNASDDGYAGSWQSLVADIAVQS